MDSRVSKLLVSMLLLSLPGCAAYGSDEPGDSLDDSFVEPDGKGDAFGVAEGSCLAIGVLEVVHRLTLEELDHQVPLNARAARNIVAARANGPIQTLEELDAIPYVGPSAFNALANYAEAEGFVRNDGSVCTQDTPVCGNGVVESTELCDTGLFWGEGSCPDSCRDHNACTIERRVGEQCMAYCEYTEITQCMDDDGCCPSACNTFSDNDCSPVVTEIQVLANETFGYVFDNNALAIDSNNRPHVVTGANAQSDAAAPITYYHYNGTAAVSSRVAIYTGFSGFPCIALNSNDEPFVCYRDDDDVSELRVARAGSSRVPENLSWRIERAASKISVSAGSMRFDGQGRLHLLYRDGNQHFAYYTVRQHGRWNERYAFRSHDIGSLTLDAKNDPILTYEPHSSGPAYRWIDDTGEWREATTTEERAYLGRVRVDEAGRRHFVYGTATDIRYRVDGPGDSGPGIEEVIMDNGYGSPTIAFIGDEVPVVVREGSMYIRHEDGWRRHPIGGLPWSRESWAFDIDRSEHFHFAIERGSELLWVTGRF